MTGPGRRALLAGLATAAVVAVGVGLTLGGGPAGPSSLSAGRSGLRGAAAWLEARGTRVVRLDRALDATLIEPLPADDVLVAAFPARRPYAPGELEAVTGALGAGGTLVVALSGQAPQLAELQLARTLGLELAPVEDDISLWPWAWWRWAREPVVLHPEGEPSLRPAQSAPAAWRAAAPDAARTLYRWPEGTPAVFTMAHGRGTVVVLPADCLCNGRLAVPGNADLLERLRLWRPGRWSFDELRHGLASADAAAPSTRAFDALVMHLAVVYGLALTALMWPFGPPWRNRLEPGGSTAAFLRAVARLHHSLGHHRDAARLLVARAAELDRSITPPELDDGPVDDATLVRLGRAVSHPGPTEDR